MTVSLSAQHVVKHYAGVVALADANLEVHSGETVALIGANGSGKSTLSKIINGVVVFDQGQLLLDDQPLHLASPLAAKKLGISTVFQELSLIPQMTVAENIWLAREPLGPGGLVDTREIRRRTEELVALFAGTIKTALHPEAEVASLPPDDPERIEEEKDRREAEAQQRVGDAPPVHDRFFRRASMRSTARQCAGAVHVFVKVVTAPSASSGWRCGRTESTERLMPATAAGGAAAMERATAPTRLSNSSAATIRARSN